MNKGFNNKNWSIQEAIKKRVNLEADYEWAIKPTEAEKIQSQKEIGKRFLMNLKNYWRKK